MTSRRTQWLVIAGYFAAVCLLHLQFSLWLTAAYQLPWGRTSPADLVPIASLAAALLLAAVVLWQLRRAARPRPLAAAWLLWLAAVWAIDRWLTYSWNEVFHYPQYALLAWLIARALDPEHRRRIAGRVLFWTTLAGAADELLQYLWVTASYSHYFDGNDVLVNLVAAAAGLLLHLGAAPPNAVRSHAAPPRIEIAITVLLALAIALGLVAGRIQLAPPQDRPPGAIHRDGGRVVLYLERSRGRYESWQPGERRSHHYVLSPRQALPLVILLGGLFVLLAGAAGGQDAAATISRSSASKSV